MTAINRQTLAESVLEGRWYLDVAATPESATDKGFLPVNGQTEIKITYSPKMEDASDQSHEGTTSQQKVGYEWGIEWKGRRAVGFDTPTEYDPGQEFIRLAAEERGTKNRIYVRVYEMEEGGPRVEAYEGWVAAAWEYDGGESTALSSVTCNMAGQGKRLRVEHPDAAAA